MKIQILILVILISTTVFSQSAITFYVSPTGNDNSSGSEKKPFKTIERAQVAVREAIPSATGDIVIFLRQGKYTIDKTLTFNATDGGSGQQKVIYKAYPGEQPRLTGGKRITGWMAEKDGIYKADVKGQSFRQLYVNNQRAIRARQPNAGDYYRLTGWDLKNRNLIMDGGYVQQWNNFENVEAVIQMFWAESFVHLKSFEKFNAGARLAYVAIKDSQAEILFPRPYPQKQDDAVFHFENALEFLDQPGEWYLDPKSEALYYKPHHGEDIHQLDIIVPVTETLLNVEGTLEKQVKNLHFEGLVFEYANWNLPNTNGFINAQAGMYNLTADVDNNQTVRRPGAAIKIKNAGNVSFQGNLFQHLGSTAIDLISGTNACKVKGNVIRSIAGNGVMVGAFTSEEDGEYHIPYNPADLREICTNDEISNNYIFQVARDYDGTCPIAAGYPAGIKIVHNHIKDAPYCGISLGYGWTSQPNAMHDNLIANNDIENVMNLICDGGGIYTLSFQPGTVIRENYIHDIKRSPWAGAWPIASMYLDEQSGGTEERPMILERNSLPTPDKSVKQWNLHREGIVFLKNNSVYRIEDVANKAGIEESYKTMVNKIWSSQ